MRAPPNKPWEHGSEFHFPPVMAEQFSSAAHPWDRGGIFLGSGRDALRALVQHGRKYRGWNRLWVPTYFCQEVIRALACEILLVAYSDNPIAQETEFHHCEFALGDALLWVNYFGLRGKRIASDSLRSVEVIEDHTHDPLSPLAWSSDADWCIASLRKTLPIPDGAVLWSPKMHPVPEGVPATSARSRASLEKLAGMVLKDFYLEGRLVSKQVFRHLAISGEAGFSEGETSGMTPWSLKFLSTFPLDEWRSTRKENFLFFCREFSEMNEVAILQPKNTEAFCPFSIVLVFKTPESREFVRKRLIDCHIYSAVLWPLDDCLLPGVSPKDAEISRLLLSIHCDMRYHEDDMRRVVSVLKSILKEIK